MIGPLNDQILGGPRVGATTSGPWPLPFTDGADASPAAVVLRAARQPGAAWPGSQPRIGALVDELIDGFAAAGAVEFAQPLPSRCRAA